jgi:hypothetical protein
MSLALEIIDAANAESEVLTDWTFGGGTALMIQIDHRESYDVDLFVGDPQVLSLLNPETQGHAISRRPSAYSSNGSASLRLEFTGVGEIDFICRPWITSPPSTRRDIAGRAIEVETVAEIIAKKIVYRGGSIQPRDLFDVAAACASGHEQEIFGALAAHVPATRTALRATEALDPVLAEAVMSSLMIKPAFEGVVRSARDAAIELFRKVAG